MKMVIDGYAGAGCITMGGYDYHGGMRQEGETKDFRAGTLHGRGPRVRRAHGQAADDVRVQRRLAVEQRRDRQLRRGPRQGRVDERQPGHGGAVLPRLQPAYARRRAQLLTTAGLTAAQHQQLGDFSADGNVVRSGTPGANNVNLLVQMLLLNYMALNGEQGQFATAFPNHGLGDPALLDRFIAFAPIV